MAPEKAFRFAVVVVVAALVPLLPRYCPAQEVTQDHSCTVDVGGPLAFPAGSDGHNFDHGWGFQAGGGFAVSRSPERGHGNSFFITANFMFYKFRATDAALATAKSENPGQLSGATSAHGSFSAVTIDPTFRHSFNRRIAVYGSGGFGWFHRGIGFTGTNPGTLLHPNGGSLDRLSSDSGVYDLGIGVNIGLRKNGGLMIFTEGRMYHGAAVNSGTILVPISVGIRW
jgi:hypothetical protein